ncbi:translation initiation factor IF-6 [Candidatus Micrarchaeota archaeon]|nr:translation initiation factor IF-6 [Candidatus Micrarchaeota archaeon]
MIIRADYRGSPHIGVFLAANDNICFAPLGCPHDLERDIRETLGVDVVKTSVSMTSLIGIFSALNNKTMIVPDILEKNEEKILKDNIGELIILDVKYTAIGNLVAMNDHGIACSPFMKDEIKNAFPLKIADSDLVGSSMYVNNRGFLAHREATDDELKEAKKIFKVDGDVGTVNFGDPYVHSGIVGNKNGVIAGSFTSGPEMNRIDDVFILSKQ